MGRPQGIAWCKQGLHPCREKTVRPEDDWAVSYVSFATSPTLPEDWRKQQRPLRMMKKVVFSETAGLHTRAGTAGA